jgi:subtilase family protein/PA domain-containing protein/PKD domain-containing protein
VFRTRIRGPRIAAFVMCWLLAAGFLVIGAAAGSAADGDLVRVTVQLDEPALAKYRDTLPGLKGVLDARTPRGHLDVKAPASRAYLKHLGDKQKDFEAKLKDAAPSAAVQWTYDTAFNGLTVEVPRDRIDAIRRLPHVVSVSPTYQLEPELDESRALLGLQTFWNSLPSSPLGSGAGLRLALIDSGVNAQHPFFNDSGFTAPAGYPKSQRVSGGVRTNMPLATYTNNKVIVANVYPYPGNTTATPWGPGSQHATHVAGIMAGRDGNYNYTSGPATFNLRFSGMAPGAYIMSYRLDGDTAEFLAAIDDVVADEADALNVSLGHSRWLTTDTNHDPIRDALDGAVDSGVVVAVSSGNAGANGDSSLTGSFKMSPKIITVANSSHGRVFSNAVSVTGPGTVPATLTTRPAIPAASPAPPIAATVSADYVVAPGGTGGSAGLACTPFAAGSLAGKIALVSRGTCTFDAKKQNVMAGGAIGMIVHNNGPDAPFAMGAFTLPAIPSVMVTLADGQALVSWANTNPGATAEIAAPLARLTSGWPDVVSASSSRGPATTMGIKPDIAAPGSSILSSSVNDQTGAVNPSALFEQLTGTSMSTPHITALGGLMKLKHPDWTVAQVKSALMNTAETRMSLDLEGNVPALDKHRGAGRVNAARLANVQLTFDPPSLSFGLLHPTETKGLKITATDMRDSGGATGFSLNVRQVVGNGSVNLSPTPTFTTTAGNSTTFDLNVTTSGAPAGDYEGFLEITGGGQTYTIPYFVRVVDPSVAKDVLLVDWDRNLGGADFRPVYTAALEGLGLSFDVFDGGTLAAGNAGLTFAQLLNYHSIILFTGNNTTSWSAGHAGGSFALEDYLVSGGKIVLSGQDFNSQYAYDQNVGSDYLYSQMSGWLTGNVFGPVPAAGPPCPATQSDRDFYGTGAANPTTAQLETAFTLLGHTGDVSTNMGGNGAGNQRFPDAGRTVRTADTLDQCTEPYNGAKVDPHARVLGRYTTTKKDGTAVSRVTEGVATGVAGDPTLSQLEPLVTWNAALIHVGLEGLNANRGDLSAQTALGLLHKFVTDNVSVAVSHRVRADRVDFVAEASSDSGAEITKYRWDFGDGSPIVETTEPRVTHEYGKGSRGTYTAYVEAVNALTRSNIASASVRIIRR